MQYGFTMDTVSFLDRLNYFSPYSRLTWTTPDGGQLMSAYTSGERPAGPGRQSGRGFRSAARAEHAGAVPAHLALQFQARNSARQRIRSRLFPQSRIAHLPLSAYYEQIDNATLSVVAPGGSFAGGDILPDLFTGNSIFNIGEYHNSGANAAVTQEFGRARERHGDSAARTAR